MKTKHQRVGIFIDVQNLYYSAKALYGAKVNFGEILKQAKGDREVIRAVAYAVRAEMPEEQGFFDALTNMGFEVKTKELQIFVDGTKKADWDVGIAVDVLKLAKRLDVIVICTGDGDFTELLHHTKAEGCITEVYSFGKSTSSKLRAETDVYYDLDLDHKRFTLKPDQKRKGRPVPKNSQKK